MPTGTVLLRAQGLSVGYDRPLLQGLDLQLVAGRVTTLLGPNGAGKSTVLRALTEPRLRLAGQLWQAPGLRLGHLAQAAEGQAELPLCGRELLALTGASADGLPPWLADCLDARLDRLSGGQLQYLRFWSIAAAPFDVLCLDEPGNNLDARGLAALRAWLHTPPAGQAVVLVTHDDSLVDAARQSVIRIPS
ncbi:ATP-binding cassette domain-containing protein [Denitromonas sp. IR12]|uniref:ATP-binding cassette domain-containing protein n=2 Tax=Denitromonas iodatirespirans TaxID=2795389 RepID=A0A944D7G8_DENI1|nr:ATP-binding cassette domain-containing protein [Denitromonas iodatirespirans]